ncbi:AfsR/SARP family transcriptional regulator [Catenulispora subtropica]|uniref:OmpR/PhoB-type domain-containing protein n=1 Tax=Catenulispora subtropica TaxID=450798 RepID=A0ABP5EQU9_9ACTN
MAIPPISNEYLYTRAIQVMVLGAVAILVDSVPIRASKLERTLIAALACVPGRVVSTERLVDVLWPHRPPSWARTRVQAVVSSLRKRLATAGGDPAAIATEAGGYVLRVDAEHVDAERFRELSRRSRDAAEAGDRAAAAELAREALELWRGPAFDGLLCASLEAEAVYLEELRLAVLEDRIDADLDAGRHAQLVPELASFRVRHPGRERLAGQLMVALNAVDRHAEALAVYRALQRHLREEYGTDPGPRIQQIHASLLHAQ